MNDTICLPGFVSECIDKIEESGFQAWVVGGSIRDLLLGLDPCDFDIATNALPDDILSIFPRTLQTGIKHGTVGVRISQFYLEVTTFRSDGDYLDNRRPSRVEYLSKIEDDLSRRDFTINAMAYSPIRGFKDPFLGLSDLKHRLVRSVGNPKDRFEEDALRILRAFRFASVLDFKIEAETLKATVNMGFNLLNISVERIREELIKLLGGVTPSVIESLLNKGSLEFLGLKGKADLYILDSIEREPYLRLAAMLWLCKGDKHSLKKLKLSNRSASEVSALLDFFGSPLPCDKIELKKLLQSKSLYTLKNGLTARKVLFNEDVSECLRWLDEVISNDEPWSISMLKVSGNDLLECGFSGKAVGKALEQLLNIVLERPELNKKEDLLKLLGKIKI